jgi:hypothetical protein
MQSVWPVMQVANFCSWASDSTMTALALRGEPVEETLQESYGSA